MLYSHKFNLGDKLKDKVTGFEGIVLAMTFYHTGCIHYGLQSKEMKDGLPIDWNWIDEGLCELVKADAVGLGNPFEMQPKKKSRGAPTLPSPPQA